MSSRSTMNTPSTSRRTRQPSCRPWSPWGVGRRHASAPSAPGTLAGSTPTSTPPAGLTTAAVLCALALLLPAVAQAQRPYPILFATQVPIPGDFTTIGSVFGNHEGDVSTVGRGGDLYLLFPNGTLRNLTQEAGYGVATGFQGAGSIAVREPCVHWSGNKAVFSMVIGAPTQRYQVAEYYWQLYEVSGLGTNDTATITKVPNQPAGYNNVSPCYGSDDRILFTSDRPFNGASHLHPQLDEYEEAETVTGLWSLDPATGDLDLLDHSPSGNFTPIVDRAGRVIFSRWDHLQRDQQADADAYAVAAGQPPPYGTFNYASEAANAPALATRVEVFPEPRAAREDLLPPGVRGHTFNHFFPWMVNQDGSELETLNHIGRHELHTYFDRAFDDSLDHNQDEFICGQNACGRTNPNPVLNLLHLRESETAPIGTFYGVDAPEFFSHATGQLVSLRAEVGRAADDIIVTWLTHPDTKNPANSPGPCHSGLYRNPLPLSDGARLVAVHSGVRLVNGQWVPETRPAANEGNRANPIARYQMRMVEMQPAGGACAPYLTYGAPLLANGITKSVSYWDPDVLVSWSGRMWELYPVEVRPRTVPPLTVEPPLPTPEANVFAAANVDPQEFQQDLREKGLALVVARDVTTRDVADEQQPYNLRVPGGVENAPSGAPVFDVTHLQLFQADLIRGIFGPETPRPGRRVLGQPMHSVPADANPASPGAPVAAVALGLDGSAAALVPAHRAMSWQLTASDGTPVVRERYWLTFQPGEIRVCGSCHGLNSEDQAGNPAPTNEPQALGMLLTHWSNQINTLHSDGFEGGNDGAWDE
jgi:hypothetical protein